MVIFKSYYPKFRGFFDVLHHGVGTITNEVHFSGPEFGDPGRILGNKEDACFLHRGLIAPVTLKALDINIFSWYMAHELIRARTDRLPDELILPHPVVVAL